MASQDEIDQLLSAEMQRKPDRPDAMTEYLLGGPDSPLSKMLEEARREAELGPPGQPITPAQLASGTLTVAATGLGFLTGGLPIAARMALQGGVGAVIGGLSTEGSSSDRLKNMGLSAAIQAAAEGLAPAAAAGISGGAKGVRGAMGGAAALLRRMQGRQALSQLIPRIVDPAAPFANKLTDSAPAVAEAARQMGMTVSPAYLVDSDIVDMLHGIASTSLTSGERMTAQDLGLMRGASAKIRDAVTKLPQWTREQLLSMLQKDVISYADEMKGLAHGHYEAVDRALAPVYATRVEQATHEVPLLGKNGPLLGPNEKPLTRLVTDETVVNDLVGNGVDLRPIKARVLELIDQAAPSTAGDLEKLHSGILEVLNKPDLVPYEQAQGIRSSLFRISKQFKTGAIDTINESGKDAQGLAGLMTEAIDSAASHAPAGTANQLALANRIWKEEVKGTLTDEFLRKIVDQQGPDFIDALLATKNPSRIATVMRIAERADANRVATGAAKTIGEPGAETTLAGGTREALQGSLLRKIIDSATPTDVDIAGGLKRSGIIDGDKLLASLRQLEGGEDGALFQAFFRNGEEAEQAVRNLRMFAVVNREVRKTQAGKLGVFFNMMQAGSIFNAGGALGVYFGLGAEDKNASPAARGVAASLGWLGIPTVLRHVMLDDKLSKWLSVGIKASEIPGGRTAARAVLVLAGSVLANRLLAGNPAEQQVVASAQAAQQVLGLPPTATAGNEIRLNDQERSLAGAPGMTGEDLLHEKILLKTMQNGGR